MLDVVRDNFQLARLVLVALVALAVLVAARRDRRDAWALVAVAAVLFVVNRPFEGSNIVRLSWNHAVTSADMIVVLALCLSWTVLRAPSRRR